jgi:hypothetical protein
MMGRMKEDTVIVRRDGWLTARIDGNLMMMNAGSDFYLNLSGSGGRIWELLVHPRTVADLCQALAAEFDIEPEAARPEVLAFLDQLLVRKAIDVDPPTLA